MNKYIMRVVRGAFTDTTLLDSLEPKVLEKVPGDWQSIEKIAVTLDQVKELQALMVKHPKAKNPWYMDGYQMGDQNHIIVAFGADDGSGGKIFEGSRYDKKKIEEIVNYGVRKGIPAEQMDFNEIGF